MKRSTIFLGDTQPERIKALADLDGITSAEVIRQAIEVYLALRETEEATHATTDLQGPPVQEESRRSGRMFDYQSCSPE